MQQFLLAIPGASSIFMPISSFFKGIRGGKDDGFRSALQGLSSMLGTRLPVSECCYGELLWAWLLARF